MEMLKELKQKEVQSITEFAKKVKELPVKERNKLYRQGELTKSDIALAQDYNPVFPENFNKQVQKSVDKKYDKIQNRVNEKVGTIQKIEKVTDGYIIEGSKDNCTLEVIQAQGPIQSLHYRTLIK